MRHSVTSRIRGKGVLTSDGAWGTLMLEKGLAAGECHELWNVTRRDEMYSIARSYLDAGSDLIETNSFGGNVFKLQRYGKADKVEEFNLAAAAISRLAAGNEAIVLGSMGPTGKLLMMGDVTEGQLYNAYKQQALSLEAGGVDALILETMSDIDEALIAVKACLENTACEVVCTMTFEKTGEKSFHTMMGVSPTQMAEELTKAGVHVIGANCGNGMIEMIDIVREIRAANPHIPILVHANAGNPVYRDGKTFYSDTPEHMASLVNPLIEAGASIIGGCCGTTPDHIRLMAEQTALFNRNNRLV